MAHLPKYYRARLDTFRYFIAHELPGHSTLDTGKRNSPLELLKNGFIHPELRERFDSRIESFAELGIELSDALLSFTELCSFNTWFAMHPEKVAGQEVVTTSMNFPLTIKGNQETIAQTFAFLEEAHPPNNEADKQKHIRIAKAKELAQIQLLQLLDI